MTTTPDAPGAPSQQGDTGTADDDGPRVSREDMRDLSRMRRTSGADRKVAGVAGGLARQVDVDPLVVRVSFVVLAFFGAGLLVYLVCWLIVPRDVDGRAGVRLDDRSRTVALAITAGVALLVLLGRSVWGFPWPLAVAGLVVLVVLLVRGGEPWGGPMRPIRTSATTPSSSTPPAPLRRRGPLLFWYALALVAVAEGSLGLVDVSGVAVPGSAYPATALGVCAVGLLVGAFWGRAGGLVLLGIVAALATALTSVVHDASAGQVRETPHSAASVADAYHLGVGELDLDLTRVDDLSGLDGRTVDVDVGVGRVQVSVPPDLEVTVVADVSVGDRMVLGHDSHGSGDSTYDGGAGVAHLTLRLHVGVGQARVSLAPGRTEVPR